MKMIHKTLLTVSTALAAIVVLATPLVSHANSNMIFGAIGDGEADLLISTVNGDVTPGFSTSDERRPHDYDPAESAPG